MLSIESLISFEGRPHQISEILAGNVYRIPNGNRWAIFTNSLRDVYRTSVRVINLSFEYLPYQDQLTKLQQLTSETLNPTVTFEHQRTSGPLYAALTTPVDKRSA